MLKENNSLKQKIKMKTFSNFRYNLSIVSLENSSCVTCFGIFNTLQKARKAAIDTLEAAINEGRVDYKYIISIDSDEVDETKDIIRFIVRGNRIYEEMIF